MHKFATWVLSLLVGWVVVGALLILMPIFLDVFFGGQTQEIWWPILALVVVLGGGVAAGRKVFPIFPNASGRARLVWGILLLLAAILVTPKPMYYSYTATPQNAPKPTS